MTAMSYRPTALVTALNGFEIEGKNLWRLPEGLNRVRVELTFQFRRPDSELTDPAVLTKACKEEEKDAQAAYSTTAATT